MLRRSILSAAASLVLLASAGAARCEDLLLLRDGGVEHGQLQACADQVCQLDGRPFRRDAIAWIGFATTSESPPAATQTAEDELHFIGGVVEIAHLEGISLGDVVTTSVDHPRDQVSWVRLAGPNDAPSQAAPTPKPSRRRSPRRRHFAGATRSDQSAAAATQQQTATPG